MLHFACIFTCTAGAICIGLMFIRMRAVAILFNSVIAGAVCAITDYLLKASGFENMFTAAMLLIFLLMTLAVQLQHRNKYGMSVMAFAVSFSAGGSLLLSEKLLCRVLPTAYGEIVGIALTAIYFIAAFKMRNSFPEVDWQDYFIDSHGDMERALKEYHIYIVSGIPCVIIGAAMAFLESDSLYSAIISILCCAALFWSVLLCVIYMLRYKKDIATIVLEQQYRSEMQSFMNVIRSQRHDYNFHVQTLAGMINSGNEEACKKYINELVADSVTMNSVLPIKDPAISAMVNNFRILAAREGIELHPDIRYDLENVVTNAYETNKIISNLLQNAIDEVKTHKDKSYGIWLYIFKRGEFCVIHVANKLDSEQPQEEYVKNIYK